MRLSRQQFTLLGIFALFMGPVLLVMLMRSSWWQYQPSGMKNLGHLVQPPVQLSLDHTADTANKWLVLYVLDPPCEQACIDSVTAFRQIHRATGRKGENLALTILTETAVDTELRARLEAIYPELVFLTDPSGNALDTLEAIESQMSASAVGSSEVNTYVIDPIRNVVLAYRADANPNDLHKDLKRLLKWSDQEGRH